MLGALLSKSQEEAVGKALADLLALFKRGVVAQEAAAAALERIEANTAKCANALGSIERKS